MKNEDKSQDQELNIESWRRTRKNKIASLKDYQNSYDIDDFMNDFCKYFEEEEGLDLRRIKEFVETPEKLPQLIKRAKKNSTHPVTEFIQELFKTLAED